MDIYPPSCRPYGITFFVGLLAPFAAIYVFNWTVFIIIMVALARQQLRSREMKGATSTKDTVAQLKQQFFSALTLSLLFGLGWGFGLPATQGINNEGVRVTFQTLFILLTAFQGLFIFVIHCLMGRKSLEVRKEWRKWYYYATCRKELAERVSKGTLTRSSAGGPKYKTIGGKSGSLTGSTTGGDSDTLRRLYGSSSLTLQRTASSGNESSSLVEGTESIVETDIDRPQDSEKLLEKNGMPLEKPSKKVRLQEQAKVSGGMSYETVDIYESAMSELVTRKRLESVPEEVDEVEAEEDLMFVNPLAEEPPDIAAEPVPPETMQSHQHMLTELTLKLTQEMKRQTASDQLSAAEEGQVNKEEGQTNTFNVLYSPVEARIFDIFFHLSSPAEVQGAHLLASVEDGQTVAEESNKDVTIEIPPVDQSLPAATNGEPQFEITKL